MRAHCREASTGSVLPFLTHVSGLSRGTKALVALAANIGVVAGIAPAGYLAERFGRKRALIGGTVAYSHSSLLSGLAGGIGEIVARCAPWAAPRPTPTGRSPARQRSVGASRDRRRVPLDRLLRRCSQRS